MATLLFSLFVVPLENEVCQASKKFVKFASSSRRVFARCFHKDTERFETFLRDQRQMFADPGKMQSSCVPKGTGYSVRRLWPFQEVHKEKRKARGDIRREGGMRVFLDAWFLCGSTLFFVCIVVTCTSIIQWWIQDLVEVGPNQSEFQDSFLFAQIKVSVPSSHIPMWNL